VSSAESPRHAESLYAAANECHEYPHRWRYKFVRMAEYSRPIGEMNS
jgi:hypothetical protein